MRLNNLTQQLGFIDSSDKKDLLAVINEQEFLAQAVVHLLRTKPTSICRSYILKHKLPQTALIEIFQTNNRTLVDTALEQAQTNPKVIPMFLQHGDFQILMNYITHHYIEGYTERQLMDDVDDTYLLHYTAKYGLTPFAKLYAIMSGKHTLISFLIAEGTLSKREKMAIVEYGTETEVLFLIDCERKVTNRRVYEEMYKIRFLPTTKLKKLVANHRLTPEAELYFYKQAPFALLVSYIKHYNPKGGQELLINRAAPEEILGYLSKNRLCKDSEKLLLERGRHDEIKAYIKNHPFTDEHEVRFIKRGKHHEIMLYLSRHSLTDIAQQKLVYRRNMTEISYYISHYPLANIALAALEKCENYQAIKLWQNCNRSLIPLHFFLV